MLHFEIMNVVTTQPNTNIVIPTAITFLSVNNNSTSQIYTESLALSKITGSENWVEMRDEILAHESILGLYLADYESLSSIGQNKVFTGIFDGKNDVSYLVDIKNMFDEEVEAPAFLRAHYLYRKAQNLYRF